jgi:tyrosinase
MFWLHHANVDRVWAIWQQSYTGVLEPLAGTDTIMDPWADTITSANDTYEYYYYYT